MRVSLVTMAVLGAKSAVLEKGVAVISSRLRMEPDWEDKKGFCWVLFLTLTRLEENKFFF